MNTKKVLVLMSTYNGEKYVAQQLDSILSQKDIDVHILIRDDGSTDTTLFILQEYQEHYPNSIDIIKGENIGWRKSFFQLVKDAFLNYYFYNYFAFADQDDIWLSEKLRHGVEKLENIPDGPNLYCSNLIYYKDGKEYGTIRKTPLLPSIKGCLIRNYATGCTIIFNKKLLKIVAENIPEIIIAHDYWFYMVATLCGSVIIDDQALILYRQHENNQIGNKSGSIEIWKRRFKSISSLLKTHNKELIATELILRHESAMSEEARQAVNKLKNYRHNLKNRIALILDKEYTFNKKSSDIWLKLRIIFGQL